MIQQLDFLLRIIAAAACGALIGFERSARNKNAGIRTHIIVGVGAAIIVIVSKYGFFDVLSHSNIALDPSRVAAQIVSGIGFIGAGAILVHEDNVNGLTTAAGIWATAGVGMAAGAGMYIIAIFSATIIILVEYLFRENILLKFFFRHCHVQFSVKLANKPDILQEFKTYLAQNTITKPFIEITSMTSEDIELLVVTSIKSSIDINQIFQQLLKEPHVIKITKL